MAKAKSNKIDLGLIFWAGLGCLAIINGLGGIKVNYVNRTDAHSAWIIPVGLVIFGGMILGVAINKFSVSIKDKNGKSKS